MQTEGKLQTADFNWIRLPCPSLRGNRKQANWIVIQVNPSDIQANWSVIHANWSDIQVNRSDIQANQSADFHFD